MVKKVVIGGLGLALVLGLLFGSNLVPYASHTYSKIRQKVNDKIPVSMQIGTARDQLECVDKEIKNMTRDVAREEVKIRRLGEELDAKQGELAAQERHIMKLKNHLDSGDEVYVSRNRTYTNERVAKDLRSWFDIYRTNEKAVGKLEKVLSIREQGLVAAKQKLQETINQRRELEVQIEHLVAHKQMLDVAKTSSKLNLDDSSLAKTREMVEDIRTRIDVEAEVLNLVPQLVGEIPMDEASEFDGDISEEVEAHFNRSDDDSAVATR